MIEPDLDYKVQDQFSIQDENWLHHIPFPLPSEEQLKVTLQNSSDDYAKKLLNMPRVPYVRRSDTIFRVLLVCSSNAASKIMHKQIKILLEEMEIHHKISVALNGLIGLEKCCSGSILDLVILDNALHLDMSPYEFMEFLRNQPNTENTLIVSLSKSSITNTADLMKSGADVIWPKPLPEKDELRKRLTRICKHYKFL
jgi:CheY-like chemotaxis protein